MGKRKVFIIGNGFDIAFKQPTRYDDLMNYILNYTINSEDNPTLEFTPYMGSSYKGKNVILGNLKSEFIKVNLTENKIFCAKKSILFSELIKNRELNNNWGNVESIYYECLKKNSFSGNVKLINEELDHLRELLLHYLNEIEKNVLTDELYSINTIQHIICDRDCRYKNLDDSDFFDSINFITFNYTSKILEQIVKTELTKRRGEQFNSEIIHIHGKLNDNDNPCVFGYGDDNSEVYKKLEDKLDFDLLRQFKTKQYLKSTQYHKLLGILEGYEIHIEIIGLSCEMCDKSLLRTIFTHPNVKKIKIDYHSNSDNYFKTVHNISKIVEDNIMLREKLEPITKCHEIKELNQNL
jgi:hypothetical protein